MLRTPHAILVVTIFVMAASPVSGQPKLVQTLSLSPGSYETAWGGISQLQYSADGKWIISIDGLMGRQTVTKWRVSDGKKISHVDLGELVVIHPDGNTIAYDGIQGPIRLLDLAKRKQSGKLNQKGQVIDAIISPDGKWMAVTGFDNRSHITIWELATRKKTFVLSHPTQVPLIKFSPDSQFLVSISNDTSLKLETLKLWDVGTGKELGSLTLAPTKVIHASDLRQYVSISPDGRFLGVPSPQTGELALFELPSLKKLTTAKDTAPLWIEFSPDSQTVATLSLSRTTEKPPYEIKLFDIEKGRTLDVKSLQNQGAISIGFSPDSQLLVSGCLDGNARLWDVATGKPRATLTGTLKEALVVPTAFSPDGRSIAVGTGKTIKIWDISALNAPP